MKHALLARVLDHLRTKETPFRAIDTHAGIGLYDLAGQEAARTQEWRSGVALIDEPLALEAEALLQPYRTALAAVRSRHGATAYPGSPALLRELLRPQDRGVLVELHPADRDALARRFRAVANLKVMRLDGWTALHALIPPKERRGVVLIDPPYEEADELDRLAGELVKAVRKWPTGIYVGWYPIKALSDVDAVAARLAAETPRPGLRLELMVERPDDASRLNGAGLFVLNPPWTLRADAEVLLPALAGRLSRAGYGAYRCDAFGPPA